jgi:hypothetical protein
MKDFVNQASNEPGCFHLDEEYSVCLIWEESNMTPLANKWKRDGEELYMSLRWRDSETFIEDWDYVRGFDSHTIACDVPLCSDDDLYEYASLAFETYYDELFGAMEYSDELW